MIRFFVLGVGLLSFLCSGCSQPGTLIGRPANAFNAPGPISVWFNHRQEGRYQSPVFGQWRDGDNLEALLLTEINAAKQEVLIAAKELSRPIIAMALATARNIRLMLNLFQKNLSEPWSQQLASHLPNHQRQRWKQHHFLADENKDGITSPDEANGGAAIVILNSHRVPWIDDTVGWQPRQRFDAPQICSDRSTHCDHRKCQLHRFRAPWRCQCTKHQGQCESFAADREP